MSTSHTQYMLDLHREHRSSGLESESNLEQFVHEFDIVVVEAEG
jgi:hypothetical protein